MRYFILATLFYFTACNQAELASTDYSSIDTAEVYRPHYHFSPRAPFNKLEIEGLQEGVFTSLLE